LMLAAWGLMLVACTLKIYNTPKSFRTNPT
jgi:hypothetical protein